MAKHLGFNDYDIAGITNAITRYKSAGLRADYDITDKAAGVVRIVLENPVSRDGSLVVFDVHKVGRRGWFRDKANWVVQLASKQPGTDLQQHGCVSGTMQAFALSAAEVDLKHGFLSKATFDLCADSDGS
ncbi:MAG: hypothetical protein GEU95_04140 [Rhizobiales bacterium]|nr:hypothetical protein [Hyphomicrobiales bacterium]